MLGPTKNLGPIGSAVLTFIGYKQNRQTDKPNLYIDGIEKFHVTVFLAKLKVDER